MSRRACRQSGFPYQRMMIPSTWRSRPFESNPSMPRTIKNILFIMCDQLRFDYLSCAGHPHLETPHIDALAARGVRFSRAYVQSPICGASRMSFYTGRYVQSHGASWNAFPLKVGEMTLGDYLRPLGLATVLVGKTHMEPDREGMERLGIDPDFDHRRARLGVRLRSLRARRRPARARSRRALRSAAAALQQLSQRQGLCRREPLARLCQRRAGRGQPAGIGLGDASCPQARARARRRIPRRPT